MEFDVNLEDLKNIYKIKSLVESDSGFKRYVYNITEEDQNKYGFQFIGEYENEPDYRDYNLNTTYRNKKKKTVYIRTITGWSVFVQDGNDGRTSPSGGGLGYKDVMSLITTALSGYTPSASPVPITSGDVYSSNVLIDGTYSSISGSNLTTILHSIDTRIAKTIMLEDYIQVNLEDLSGSPEVIYSGQMTADGKWYIKKILILEDNSTIIKHSNVSNNPTHVTYDDAWNNRSSLIYSNLEDLIFT